MSHTEQILQKNSKKEREDTFYSLLAGSMLDIEYECLLLALHLKVELCVLFVVL